MWKERLIEERWVDRMIEGWKDEVWKEGWKDRRMEEQRDGKIDGGRMERGRMLRIGGWKDERMNGRKNEQNMEV